MRVQDDLHGECERHRPPDSELDAQQTGEIAAEKESEDEAEREAGEEEHQETAASAGSRAVRVSVRAVEMNDCASRRPNSTQRRCCPAKATTMKRDAASE